MPEETEPMTLSGDPELERILEASARAGMCPPPDLLFAAQEDVLPAAAGAAIRAHADACVLCQTLLEGLAPAESALSPGSNLRIRTRLEDEIAAITPVHAEPLPAVRQTVWDYAPIAAILVLAVASFLLFRWMHGPVAPQSAEKAPAVAAPVAPAPVEIAEMHAIAPLSPPQDAALTTRDAAGVTPSTAELLPGFRAYNRGDFAAAAAAFVPVVARFPKADVPALYLGVAQLELNDNAAARATLEHAKEIAAPVRRDAADWFLAVATLRTGDNLAATPLLQTVCAASGSVYSQRACVLAAQIGGKK